MNSEKINWPEKFNPSNCPVFVHNEIDIDASPEQVWFWLTNAITWPNWYKNAADVKIINQQNNHLSEGTLFTWKTFGAHLKSEVHECVPNQRLAWKAKGTGILAYHAWLIIPTANGCKVVTQETQHGFLCRLQKLFMPKRMHKYHQKWLEGLKAKSEKK